MKAPELLGGRYELHGVLGRGGMAEVRDGWDTRLARPVAIKILYPLVDRRPDSRRRFEAEARAAARLNNSHIVAVHDSGEHGGMPFIVMERLTGESLQDRINAGPLPQPFVRAVLDAVLSALATAHAGGILHRDIKPANILFTSSGEVKLSDFGVAKSAQLSLTATGQVFGTMAYLSPDRVLGRPASVADDLYALGVVGYEALAGRRPFAHENIAALAAAILHETPPPIAALRPDVDPVLASLVGRAMARDPAARFGSAAQMQAALAGHAVAPSGTRVLDAAPMAVASGPSRRTKLLALGAILAALLLGVLLLALGSSQSSSPGPLTTSTPVPSPTTAAGETSSSPPPTTTEIPVPNIPPGHQPGKKHGKHKGD
ncbi:MAG TPA: serine/threonine-protein kinase [Mycobacterium sp.]